MLCFLVAIRAWLFALARWKWGSIGREAQWLWSESWLWLMSVTHECERVLDNLDSVKVSTPRQYLCLWRLCICWDESQWLAKAGSAWHQALVPCPYAPLCCQPCCMVVLTLLYGCETWPAGIQRKPDSASWTVWYELQWYLSDGFLWVRPQEKK